jgi:hypothetical protein
MRKSGLITTNAGGHTINDHANNEIQTNEEPKLLNIEAGGEVVDDSNPMEKIVHRTYIDEDGDALLLPPGIDPTKCLDCD